MSAPTSRPGVCDFCGLPLPRAPALACSHPLAEEPRFCCFGCRFASGVMDARGGAGQVTWALARLGLSIFFTMNVMVFTMALWSRDIYSDAGASSMADSFAGLFRYLGLVFSLPVLLLLGGPIVEEAWNGLRRRTITTDLLIVMGVAAAYVVSVLAVVRGAEHVYFEVGCVVLVLVALGRWLEASARHKATSAIDALEKLLPARARRVGIEGESEVDLHELAAGDLVRVLPGERFPTDGTIRRNVAAVDEQLFTGECWPVTRGPGDRILGGTLSIDGDVDVEVTAAAAEGTFARLVAAVRHARDSRTGYETLADSATTWFVPAVAVIALLTFAFHSQASGFEPALMASLSVVLIACPCALGLATPLAVWCALGRATREQVLFRRGDAIERLAAIRVVRFDKTGTLTTGLPRVEKLVCDDGVERNFVASVAAGLASRSTHSFARAVSESSSRTARPVVFAEVDLRPGKGLRGVSTDGSRTAVLGNGRLLSDCGWTVPDSLRIVADSALRAGQPFSFVGWNGRARGVYVFHESLRSEAAETMDWFHKAGFDVGVLTGDHRTSGERLSRELHVRVDAGLLPDGKVAAIRQAHQRIGPVLFVGDGVNDAPALLASHVGAAMGCGADLTRETADVCLLGNDLSRLPWLIELSRTTCRTIRWNLVWAFGYNGLGVAVAACGLLYPGIAALLMVVSSLLVIANSLRIQHFPASRQAGAIEGTAGDVPRETAITAHGRPEVGAA